MNAKVTRLFSRNGSRVWQPAPERQSIPQPTLTLEEQLLGPVSLAPPAEPDLDATAETTDPLEEIAPPIVLGPATQSANQRQRLRHANELLRTFTKSA